MKKVIKKILCTALACSLLLVGCGGKKIEKNEVPDNTFEVSEDDALDAFKTIISKAKSYVKNNDYTSYESLWEKDELDMAKTVYDNLNKCITEGYTNEDYYVICELSENEFAVGFMASKALKQGNSTKTESMCYNAMIKNTNTGWKLNASKESNERFISQSLEMIPENAKVAYQKQKFSAFNSDYNWTNRDVVVEGDITSSFAYMWENEDGTVEIMMNIMNGTLESKDVDYFTVKVTNDNGVVFEEKFTGPGVIEPLKSNCSIYVIPADRVYQDASKWGGMYQNTSVHLNSKEDNTEKPTEKNEGIIENTYDYFIEEVYVGDRDDVDIIFDNIFYAHDTSANGLSYIFFDKDGNRLIEGVNGFQVIDEGVVVEYRDKEYWELRDENLNLIFDNSEYKEYSFCEYNNDVIHIRRVRMEYVSELGTVYDDIFFKKTDDGFTQLAKFSRDSITGYVSSGSYYDNKFLVITEEVYYENGSVRKPLYITLDGGFESYTYSPYVGFCPINVFDDKEHYVLLHGYLDEVIGGKYVKDGCIYIYNRSNNKFVGDLGIDGLYSDIIILGYTKDYIIVKERAKTVVLSKYTGKCVYEIDGYLDYGYDTDIWVINKDGKYALMKKDGKIISDWYYDCSGYNGDIALVKKTEESPITVVEIEEENGEYTVVEYVTNYYGSDVSYSGIENYFYTNANAFDNQLVVVNKNSNK